MQREAYDELLLDIAEYACQGQRPTAVAMDTARLCMLDALGCLAGALDAPDIRPILGPVVPGTSVPLGCRVPGTSYVLDPIRAAFNTSALIRWLDFSDTTFRGGHPSDSIGAVLACAEYVSRRETSVITSPLTMRDVFEALVQTYEIQGVLADSVKLDAPSVGFDAVLGVKLACAAVCARVLGGTAEHVLNALSNAVLDAGTLNAYRQPPNAGTRKGWAGADAASRGVWFAMMSLAGEMGYPQPLTASPWGFCDVVLGGRPIELRRPLGCSVMENIIFKLLPCQRNATTAAEAALALHPAVAARVEEIRHVTVFTHAEAIERIDRKGRLPNAAARDHCLQFIVAAALIFGELRSEHYHEPLALDSRIDGLRHRMRVVEDVGYTRDYLDPATLSCANALQVEFQDGSVTPRVEVVHPAGDPVRRSEALPSLRRKFVTLTQGRWSDSTLDTVLALFSAPDRLDDLRVRDFLELMIGECR
jgi:2-methylcitrate dehydratase